MVLNLIKISNDEFPFIYSDMQKQFPQSELKSFAQFQKLFNSGCYFGYKAIDNDVFTGYVIVADFENIIWLDYIAVLKEFHSKGYGHKILKALKDVYKNKCGCILEVECPDENEPNTLRRIKFYQNLGAQKQPVNYFYPNQYGCVKLDLYLIKFAENCNINFKNIISGVFELLHSDIPHYKDVLNRICSE